MYANIVEQFVDINTVFELNLFKEFENLFGIQYFDSIRYYLFQTLLKKFHLSLFIILYVFDFF